MSASLIFVSVLGPVFAFILFGVIARQIKIAIDRKAPDGWLKQFLLKERIKSQYGDRSPKIEVKASVAAQLVRKADRPNEPGASDPGSPLPVPHSPRGPKHPSLNGSAKVTEEIGMSDPGNNY
jgi:hypothetical protein